MKALVASAVLLAYPVSVAADGYHLSPEVDPLPFALGGFGAQLGVRRGPVRIAPACFSLNVPDMLAELGGNDGFHIRVRPSPAVYVLYFPTGDGRGWWFGGAMRFLRLRYTHEDVAGEAETTEVSPEAIGGYRWFPTHHGFYVQPWIGLSFTAYRSGDLDVGTLTYDPLPVQLFATVNLGWEI